MKNTQNLRKEHLDKGMNKYIVPLSEINCSHYSSVIERIRDGRVKYDGILKEKESKISQSELKKLGIEVSPSSRGNGFNNEIDYSNFKRTFNGESFESPLAKHIHSVLNNKSFNINETLEGEINLIHKCGYDSKSDASSVLQKCFKNAFNKKIRYLGKHSSDLNFPSSFPEEPCGSTEIETYTNGDVWWLTNLSYLHSVLSRAKSLISVCENEFTSTPFERKLEMYILTGQESLIYNNFTAKHLNTESQVKSIVRILEFKGISTNHIKNLELSSKGKKIIKRESSRSLLKGYFKLCEEDKFRILTIVTQHINSDRLNNNTFYAYPLHSQCKSICYQKEKEIYMFKPKCISLRGKRDGELCDFQIDLPIRIFEPAIRVELPRNKENFEYINKQVSYKLGMINNLAENVSISLEYPYESRGIQYLESLCKEDYREEEQALDFICYPKKLGYFSPRFVSAVKSLTPNLPITPSGRNLNLEDIFLGIFTESWDRFVSSKVCVSYYINRKRLITENLGINVEYFSSLGSPIIDFEDEESSEVYNSNTYFYKPIYKQLLVSENTKKYKKCLVETPFKYLETPFKYYFSLKSLNEYDKKIIKSLSKKTIDAFISDYVCSNSFFFKNYTNIISTKIFSDDYYNKCDLEKYNKIYIDENKKSFFPTIYVCNQSGKVTVTKNGGKTYYLELFSEVSSHLLTNKKAAYVSKFFENNISKYENINVDGLSKKASQYSTREFNNLGSLRPSGVTSEGLMLSLSSELKLKNHAHLRIEQAGFKNEMRAGHYSYKGMNNKILRVKYDYYQAIHKWIAKSPKSERDIITEEEKFQNMFRVSSEFAHKILSYCTVLGDINAPSYVPCYYSGKLIIAGDSRWGWIDEGLDTQGHFSCNDKDVGYLSDGHEVDCVANYEWLENSPNWIYNESQELYMTHEENDSYDEDEEDYDDESSVSNGYCKRYHYWCPRPDKTTSWTKSTIGIEVEKEDYGSLESEQARDIYGRCLLMKETDSSLGSDGFELITPVFDLHKHNFDKWISDNRIEYLYNSGRSSRCGMHAHIGRRGLSGVDYFDLIKFYIPLLYAMYEVRVDNSYSVAKSVYDLRRDRARTQAVGVLNDRLEIRLFPSPKGVKTLLWRIELLRIMDKKPLSSVDNLIRDILDKRTRLHKHLRKVYSEDRLTERLSRVSHYIHKFEDAAWKIESVVPRKKLRDIKYPNMQETEVSKLVDKNLKKNKMYGSLGYDEEVTDENREQLEGGWVNLNN